MFFLSCVSYAFASVRCYLVITCWEKADLIGLAGYVYCIFATFPCGVLGQVWYLIVSFSNLCNRFYFYCINMFGIAHREFDPGPVPYFREDRS